MIADLTLRQKSMWNGFSYEFAERSGRAVGGLEFPNFPQAKNARLAVHPRGDSAGDSKVRLHGEHYLLRFEYTRRGFINDIRYTLETPAHGVLCAADVVFEAQRQRPAIRLTTPMPAEILPSTALWQKRFPIVNAAGAEIGEVYEPRALTLRFEYCLRLPSASPQLQAFLLMLTFLVRR